MTDTTAPAGATRVERDSMGEMEVPADALYGASTQRAVLNFPISGQPLPRRFIRALALIKQAAAEANQELGLLPADVAEAIAAAAAEVAEGRHDAQFPIDVYQTGSGTSTNTNMNEVVATLATRRLGGDRRVHPNDDVNKCQSSNDTIPTALQQLSAAVAIEEELLPALEALQAPRSTRRPTSSGRSSRPAGPTSRTRRRSGSARSSGATPARSRSRSAGARRRADELLVVPLGGTAVGTGINAHPEYAAGLRPPLGAHRPRRPRVAEPLPRPGHDRRRDRRPRRDPDDRADALEDRLGRAADGHGARGPASPRSRCRRRSPARRSCRAR